MQPEPTRAAKILAELEAGVQEAGEAAWYGFISLDDVRWALAECDRYREAIEHHRDRWRFSPSDARPPDLDLWKALEGPTDA